VGPGANVQGSSIVTGDVTGDISSSAAPTSPATDLDRLLGRLQDRIDEFLAGELPDDGGRAELIEAGELIEAQRQGGTDGTGDRRILSMAVRTIKRVAENTAGSAAADGVIASAGAILSLLG
jgi:hypothetical protein